MKDPYVVLGVSPRASDDEIKKAYRDLVRKYHPDNYHNNPLADLASEKMKEINEAYDSITKSRAAGGNAWSAGSAQGYSGSSYTSPNYSQSRSSASSGSGASSTSRFTEVRKAIQRGEIDTAEWILNITADRDAEWYFLKGSINYKRGWMDEARRCFQRAIDMDPHNAEYLQAMAILNASVVPESQTGRNVPATGTDVCDICTAMVCTNFLCRGCC